MRSRLFAIFGVALLLLAGLTGPVAAAPDFNEDAEAAQNPYITADVTVDGFDRGEMSVGEYEDDSGEIVSLPASVVKSEDVDDIGTGEVNPYTFVASDINFSDAGAFPRDKDSVSALDASEWSTDTSSSAGSMSVSDSETAPGVDAVSISTSSQSSGDTAVATFGNFSVTSDVEKRYLQAVMDVNTLDSGTTLELRATDSDGDYVVATLDSGATASDADVIGATTGEGFVFQEQVGGLSVQGSGDGAMGEIQSIDVHVVDGNADIDVSALNVQKTSEWGFGAERVDSDDDDEFETNTIRDVSEPGAISIHDVSTMSGEFDSAEIAGITMPMEFAASDLDNDSDLVDVTFDEATNYPSFEWRQEAYYRLQLPDAYDLSYANAALEQEVSVPENRYSVVEIAEGASGTDFEDIDSWTDKSGSLSSEGTTVELDSTIQVGQEIVVHESVLVTEDEKSAVQAVGGVGQFGSSGGGILDMILSPFGAIAGAVGALLARARGVI